MTYRDRFRNRAWWRLAGVLAAVSIVLFAEWLSLGGRPFWVAMAAFGVGTPVVYAGWREVMEYDEKQRQKGK